MLACCVTVRPSCRAAARRTRSRKWGAGSRITGNRLFLDAVLVNGSMDRLAQQPYRQVEGCIPSPPPPTPPAPPYPEACVDTAPDWWCVRRKRADMCKDEHVGRRHCRASCANWCTPSMAHLAMVKETKEQAAWVTRSVPFVYAEGIDRSEMLSTCGSLLFNKEWSGYRITDMLRSRFLRHSTGGSKYHQAHFPGSFVDLFIRQYAKGGERFVALPPNCTFEFGPCEWVDDHVALADLIRREDGGIRSPTTAALQIRAGDVIDRSPYSVHEMLEVPTNFSWKCPKKPTIKIGGDTCNNLIHQVPPLQYVRTRAHWLHVAGLLRARGVSRVSILASSHFNLTDVFAAEHNGKSCAYIAVVGDLLESAGLVVRYRLGRPPDDDIRFMSRVKVVAPSGGGFATVASEAAALLGVEVL
jgi:hypothetical protein